MTGHCGQECGKGSSRTPGAELPPVTAESLIGRVDTAETHGRMAATGSCICIRATSCYTSQKYPRLSIKKFSTFPAPFLQSGQLWHASQVSTVTRLLALAASLQRNKMKSFGNNIRHLTSTPQSAKNSGPNERNTRYNYFHLSRVRAVQAAAVAQLMAINAAHKNYILYIVTNGSSAGPSRVLICRIDKF